MIYEENAMSPDRDERAALWYLDLAEGNLSGDQRTAFEQWINDPDNARAFQDAARIWASADGAAELPKLIYMRSAALEGFRRANRQRWTKRISGPWHWAYGVAAVLAITALIIGMLYRPTLVVQTGIGERRIAILEDGSRLSLDADTEVDVRLSNGRRQLTLARGRAKFDVAKDPLRPFTVTAGDRMVVATGTSFSVEMLNKQIHVLLYEGHVAIIDKSINGSDSRQREDRLGEAIQETELTPGRELIASADTPTSAIIVERNPIRSLSWEGGQLNFDDEPLSTAVLRMNRYSFEKLQAGDVAAANTRVNGVFTAGNTAAFVEGVAALNALHVVREPGKVILRSN